MARSDEQLEKRTPLGIKCCQLLCTAPPCIKRRRMKWCQGSVLVLTYLIYTAYRIARKPSSVVKNVLNRNCSELEPPQDIIITPENQSSWCNWAPFDGDNADSLLGSVDSAMLFGYAAGMFLGGWAAERLPVRAFMVSGMILTSTFTFLFGMGYYLNIHQLAFFLVVQVLSGLFQATGAPATYRCVGQWFKNNRGVIFGVWNSNCFIGNILGNIIAGVLVESAWGLSFIVPAIILAVTSLFSFFFLATEPREVDCVLDETEQTEEEEKIKIQEESDETKSTEDDTSKPIGMLQALKVPGVVEYSLSIFCSKLVTYTFMFWLPRYMSLSAHLSAEDAAFVSSMFDVGGIIGSALIGIMSDKMRSGAMACGIMQILTLPATLLYQTYSVHSITTNVILLIIVGILVNGPYCLITTTVCADLGSDKSLKGNVRAMATMVGIINGCGSIGGAVGPFIAGVITNDDINGVFLMLNAFNLGSLMFLLRVIFKDMKAVWKRKRKSASEEGLQEPINTV